MLECIKFGDFKIKTIQMKDDWFVSVRHIYITLGVSPDTLKGIVRHHLPQQYKFSRKEISIDDFYDSSKLFTTIPGACRVLLGSIHPDNVWKAQKTKHLAHDDSILLSSSHLFYV